MRLDLFLKSSRLIARRTLAQEFCDAGLVRVNGTPAKSSKEINTGDEITIDRRTRKTSVRVSALPQTKQVAKAHASDLYELLSNETKSDDLLP